MRQDVRGAALEARSDLVTMLLASSVGREMGAIYAACDRTLELEYSPWHTPMNSIAKFAARISTPVRSSTSTTTTITPARHKADSPASDRPIARRISRGSKAERSQHSSPRL